VEFVRVQRVKNSLCASSYLANVIVGAFNLTPHTRHGTFEFIRHSEKMKPAYMSASALLVPTSLLLFFLGSLSTVGGRRGTPAPSEPIPPGGASSAGTGKKRLREAAPKGEDWEEVAVEDGRPAPSK
jgi:hypothetical protein